MRQHTLIAVLAVGLLALTACGTGESDQVTEPRDVATIQEATTEASDPTAPGEVCDPRNLNDSICAAFYPETAADNMLSRQKEPVASMGDEEQVELLETACSILESGGSPESDPLVDIGEDEATRAVANENVYSIATYGYCQDQMPDDRGAWLVNYYADLGEDAAKVDFADGVMPETPFDAEMFAEPEQ